MKVVALKKYDDDPSKALEVIEYPIPEPSKDEVLIEVYAASLNPIDARIRAGYGKTIFAGKAPLPIVLGRDFSGVITKIGKNIEGYVEGDKVLGVVSPFRACGMKQGSHANYICASISEITKKPDNVDFIQAASLPYVALTTYSALITQAGMQCKDYADKCVLVHAGAGGVGSYAIQFLKALGAYVVTTCSTVNVDYVYELGADEVIDYKKEDYTKKVKNCDVVYDLLGKSYTEPSLALLKSMPPSNSVVLQIESLLASCLEQLNAADETWNVPKYKNILKRFDGEVLKLLTDSPKYISIVGPMMPLTDAKGLQAGMHQFVSETLERKARQAKEHGRFFNYSFFEPNAEGLKLLVSHVSANKIKPFAVQTFSMFDAPLAHQTIETGRTRGKIVFTMN